MYYRILILFILTVSSIPVLSARLIKFVLKSRGIRREFYLAFNQGKPGKSPVLFAFHGGGGTALNAERQYRFAASACDQGYVVVYPQGINNQWYDGRVAPAKGKVNDDVHFIKDILVKLTAICKEADTAHIFCTGISNGGFFSFYLAYKLNTPIVAIAPVCASIPRDLETTFSLYKPIPMLLVAGTADPLVKYDGGWVGFRDEDRGRGYSMPIKWTLQRWIGMTECDPEARFETIPDLDPDDGCRAEKSIFKRNGKDYLIFIKIENGGHAWPGGRQYLPPTIIGKLCNDFSATETILTFFNTFRGQ